MSNITITLYDIINNFYTREEVESWFTDYELSDYLTEEQIALINKHGVWNKQKLARKIVDHYLMNEIGVETIALFKLRAKVKMQEIMEEKLPAIYTQYLEYDPLSNVDYIETYTRQINGDTSNTGTSNSDSNSNTSGLNVSSNTPQGQISKETVLRGDYASSTSASESESNISDTTTTSNTGVSHTTETYTHEMKGDNGVIITNQRLVKEFRENIIGIDREIINELSSLFISVYSI